MGFELSIVHLGFLVITVLAAPMIAINLLVNRRVRKQREIRRSAEGAEVGSHDELVEKTIQTIISRLQSREER